MNERMLTVEQLAERYNVQPVTARKWCQRGVVPARKHVVGDRAAWLVHEDDLAGFVPPSGGRPRKV